VPLCRRVGPKAVSTDGGRQTPVGAVLRVLAPLDGSGFARGTCGSLARTVATVASRRFAALFHAARVPGAALQSFPFPRSRSRSRGTLLPCGFRWPITAGAEPPRSSRSLSPSRQLFARATHPEVDRGRTSRDDSSSRSLVGRLHTPFDVLPLTVRSRRHWARRVSHRHARFEALLPPGVRSLDNPMPWPGRGCRVGALLGFFPSRVRSTSVQGSVSRVDARSRDGPCTSHDSRNPAASLRSRDPDSDAWVHEPRIRRHARSIEPRAPPSGSHPAHARFASARAPVTSSARTFPCARSVLPAPPLGGAPRLPRPWRQDPVKGSRRWTSETRSLNRRPDPTPRGAGWRPTPREVSLISRCRVDPDFTRCRVDRKDPASREAGPVVGPPVARWADSCRVSSLVEPTRRFELTSTLGLSNPSDRRP